MLALVFTAFLPVVGVKFAWVYWHWMAGILLTGSIIFHIIHATFFMDFWSIWVGPKDIPEAKAEIMRDFGVELGGRSPAVPARQPLYHLAVLVAGLAAIGTGLLMMSRIRRRSRAQPRLMGDAAHGVTYVLHGLAGVGFVGSSSPTSTSRCAEKF